MLRLSTIGPVSIQIGDSRVPAANQQVISALLFLTMERGKAIARRTLAEMFFPDASDDAAAHSGRQLIYRLRKLGADIEADQLTVTLPAKGVTWDVDELLAKGWASEDDLRALARGYLADFSPEHSARFSSWLDEHRGEVSNKLRHLLIAQIQSERSQRRYRALENVARACLALDPLNEEATLAAAESLAMAGSKIEAIALLDNYLAEIGSKSRELTILPRILRERISEYVVDSDSSGKAPLVGRERELSTIMSAIEASAAGAARACTVTGPSGIGKTRLLNEACSLAALPGNAIVRATLHSHDANRPFAILRDVGPALLDLPGAIGASPEALASVRGLCGRGPTQFQSVPPNAFAMQSVVAGIHARVIELIDAIASEQPIVVCVEDGHWIDAASLELIAEILDDRRAICFLIASQRPVPLPERISANLGVTALAIPPLTSSQSFAVLEALFHQMGQTGDPAFIDSTIRTAGGVPFYLHVLFRNFQLTGDPKAIPKALSDSLAARLDRLSDHAKAVLDATVVLGSDSSAERLEAVTQLPRFALMIALRTLDEGGLIRFGRDSVTASHDLFAAACRKRMPTPVAQLLHRTAAAILEADANRPVEPLAIAAHWEECGEGVRALDVLTTSADRSLRLGRPREAIALLDGAQRLAAGADKRREVDTALFRALHAAGEFVRANEIADRINLLSGSGGPELQVTAVSSLYAAGWPITKFLPLLSQLVADAGLSSRHRSQAARLLETIAEDLQDEQLGRFAMDSVRDLSSVQDALLPRMIFETVFGSRISSVRIALELCEAALLEEPRTTRLETLQNGSYALWRCGEIEAAIRYQKEAYEIARSSNVWSACTAYSAMIAEMYWYSGDLGASREWFEIAQNHFSRTSTRDRGEQVLSLGVMFALESKDPGKASQLLDEAEKLYPRILENRLGVEGLAYRMRISLARGQIPEGGEISKLVDGLKAHSAAGIQDIVADTAIEALRVSGRNAEAEALRNEYLFRYRKEGFPPPTQLASLCTLPARVETTPSLDPQPAPTVVP